MKSVYIILVSHIHSTGDYVVSAALNERYAQLEVERRQQECKDSGITGYSYFYVVRELIED